MMLANPTRQMFAQQQTAAANMDGTGIDHHHLLQHQHQHPLLNTQPAQQPRKRKAETQPENNERLSKRMSLLNLEQNGTKLYVPVENPGISSAPIPQPSQSLSTSYPPLRKQPPPQDDDTMHLDDTKYKVYIYNMEDELSSESENETDNNGKLVFLPDIEKHLRNNRRTNNTNGILPPYMLSNPAGGPDPADMAQMQMVLYNIPSSITVPEEQDSVRKAIIEARTRMRERQREEQETGAPAAITPAVVPPPTNGFQSCAPGGDDPDAMELD